jgi:hypothetical protein
MSNMLKFKAEGLLFPGVVKQALTIGVGRALRKAVGVFDV